MNFSAAANLLSQKVEKVIRVSKTHLNAFNRLGIYTLKDLLFRAPRSYKIKEINPSLDSLLLPADVVLTGVLRVRPERINKKFVARVEVQGRIVNLIFFRDIAQFLKLRLRIGCEVLVEGKLLHYNGSLQMLHPEFLFDSQLVTNIEPIYPLAYGISNKRLMLYISKAMELAKDSLKSIPECNLLARSLLLPKFFEAIQQIHKPTSKLHANEALTRLAIDELKAHRLCLINRSKRFKTTTFGKNRNLQAKALENLQISLSKQQEEAIAEIEADQALKAQMLRLLQGDVGSGKTVVALLTALNVASKGLQTALLAPTELLAQQHNKYFESALKGTEIKHCLLTGSLSASERKKALDHISSGYHIAIGTHALFQDGVAFKSLAYIIVDEQHRFGVKQRLSLINKAIVPDILLLSATPIPRSLSLTTLGNISVSKLERLPGRGQTSTLLLSTSKKEEVYKAISNVISKGHKVYWICPLIETPEEIVGNVGDLERTFNQLSTRFPNQTAALHGMLDARSREKAMEEFCSGKVKILVATTIVETGIDIKDATMIIIESADRFGLAQLHQLRGRVGRNNLPAHCILLHEQKISPIARRRLELLKGSTDGFFIAKEDLKIRGGGDMLGTKQSGKEEFYFADKIELQESIYDAIVESTNRMQDTDFFTQVIHLKADADEFLSA